MAGDGWSLVGKVAIVTGATSGLGRVAAEALARDGARVFLVCRDEARARRAAQEIVAETRNADVEILVGDLSSQRSVRATSPSGC